MATIFDFFSKGKLSIVINALSKVRGIFLLLSKIGFILASLYYCYNFKYYSITFHIPSSWRIGIINQFLSTVESFGLLIMVIPLSIVIISFIIVDSRVINILAALSAVGGNIFTLMQMLSSGLFEERFKAGFFTVYHTISQQKKEQLFRLLFDEKITTYPKGVNSIDYQIYVQKIVDTNWITYINNLKSLGIDQVERYSSSIVESIHKSYVNGLVVNSSHSTWDFLTFNWFKIGSGLIIGTLLAYVLYTLFARKMQEVGSIAKDTATVMQDVSKTQTSMLEQALQSNNLIKDNSTSISGNADSIQVIIEKIRAFDTRLQGYGDQLNLQGNAVLDLKKELYSMTEKLAIYSPEANAGNILSELVKTNINSNLAQRLLAEKLELVKNDCTLAIEQLTSRVNAINSPVMRSSEPVVLAATIREYQSAMDKIKNFNAKEVIAEVKGDLVKLISTQHNATQVQIDELTTTTKASVSNLKHLAKDTNAKIDNLKTTQIKSEENVRGTLDSISQLNKKVDDNVSNLTAKVNDQEQFVLTSVEDLEKKLTVQEEAVNSNFSIIKRDIEILRDNQESLRNEVHSGLNTFREHLEDFKGFVTQKLKSVNPGQGIVAHAVSMIKGINSDNHEINLMPNVAKEQPLIVDVDALTINGHVYTKEDIFNDPNLLSIFAKQQTKDDTFMHGDDLSTSSDSSSINSGIYGELD